MHAQGLTGVRLSGSRPDAIAAIRRSQMAQAIDEHLDRMASIDEADRSNDFNKRCQWRRHGRKSTIVQYADISTDAFFRIKGRVRVTYYSECDREVTLRIIRKVKYLVYWKGRAMANFG
jgi:hypothetical protein